MALYKFRIIIIIIIITTITAAAAAAAAAAATTTTCTTTWIFVYCPRVVSYAAANGVGLPT